MARHNLNRREFLKSTGIFATGLALAGCAKRAEDSSRGDRPNILWITCEDISPYLGCYGDSEARTPNIDKLASQGTRYTNAYATAPVCAPARSCLITGVYATSMGTQHLRSHVELPSHIKCFTQYLREAGYYCSNNYKKDYNFEDVDAWNESSENADWRKRRKRVSRFSAYSTSHRLIRARSTGRMTSSLRNTGRSSGRTSYMSRRISNYRRIIRIPRWYGRSGQGITT